MININEAIIMLKQGDKIRILTKGEATILEELGSGGQGTVYKVCYGEKEYALKWYHKPSKPKFYENLKCNIEKGSPASCFLWPLFITEKDEKGRFGYLMELRDPSYKEFSDFLLAKEHFSTVSAMVEAAIKICVSFRQLHNKGYSYQDLNDGNFFINPITGDVLICDNDNIAPSGENMGVLGKCRYMAPEIITRKKSCPDTQSDRFSLAVILFLLFFNNHPLEGERISRCPCMTEKNERLFYGDDPVFIYDLQKQNNRPVEGIHINVIQLWPLFPKYVRDMFIDQFSEKVMHEPGRRITEKEWLEKVLLRMRHELVKCPACGNEIFLDIEQNNFVCSDCQYKIQQRMPIIQSGSYRVAADRDKKVYQYITNSYKQLLNTCTGIIVESKKTSGLFGLRNLTQETWILTMKNGKTRPIEPGETVPLLIGNEIAFGNGSKATIL